MVALFPHSIFLSFKKSIDGTFLTNSFLFLMEQLHLYRKGLATLEAPEPNVKKIAEEQPIEYQLDELEEDDGYVSFEFYPKYDESTTNYDNSMEVHYISPSFFNIKKGLL